MEYTIDDAMEMIAKSLRDFGFPDVTAQMIREIYDQWKEGNRYPNLPHGIVGSFAEHQFDEVADELKRLPGQ